MSRRSFTRQTLLEVKLVYQPNIWSEVEGFNGWQLVGRFGAERVDRCYHVMLCCELMSCDVMMLCYDVML